MGDQVLGKTRWRWFGVPFVPALAAVGVMFYLIATGVLAVSLSISGIPFTLTANQLSGNNFVQYAEPDATSASAATNAVNPFIDPTAPFNTFNQFAEQKANAGGNNVVYAADTVTGFGSASINQLKQWVCVPLPALAQAIGLGPFFIAVTEAGSGSGGNASASNLVVYAPGLSADSASFNSMAIGTDLGTAIGDPAKTGQFAQAANSATINGVKQVGLGTTAGTFTLPNLTAYAAFADGCPK